MTELESATVTTKLESFRNDPVIADAVETLHQELDGPEAGLEMGGL